MKSNILIKAAWLIAGFAFLFNLATLNAQNTPYKARMSADYMQSVGQPGYLQINVKYRDENKEYHPAIDLTLNVYKEVAEDSLTRVGEAITNADGIAKYIIRETPSSFIDTVLEQRYVVKIEGSNRFKKANKKVAFVYSFLSARIIEKDSINYVEAKLLDATGNPLEGEKISIQVKRLFGNLDVGDSYYKTNESGEILVALEEDISSKTGDLTFKVFIDNSDLGIVNYWLESSIGSSMEELSTYDERTMWAPPSKTPIFLLVFANALILGMWFVIFYIVYNLFKIKKTL